MDTLLLVALAAGAAPLWAQNTTPVSPKGRVVLTVTGAIGKTNAAQSYQFDMAMIDALPGPKPRIVDASTAHRCHPDWVFGFPELAADQAGGRPQKHAADLPG
jgi:hypothetical protein